MYPDFTTSPCPPCGPRDAKIVIVGEAPGEHEIIQRKPFVGASGQMLDRLLASAGIDRNSCYLTNVVKQRPIGNDFGHFYERTKKGKLDEKRHRPTALLQAAIINLSAELESLSPNVILLLGNEPLRAVASRRGITKWRGSILSTSFGKCVPTIHPAAILREYGNFPIVQLDLRRLAEESRSRDISIPRMDFILQPTCDQVLTFIRSIGPRFAFDIETIGKHVRCLSLSYQRGRAICIPFICRTSIEQSKGSGWISLGSSDPVALTSYWSETEERTILEALNELFLDKSKTAIAQNFPYDSTVLGMEFGFDIANSVEDTMLKHHTLYAELPKGLDFLCSIYTRTPYYSDYESKDDRSTWIYNCYDSAITFEVDEVTGRELVEASLEDVYYKDKLPTMLAMTRAQNRGVLLDEVERAKQKAEAITLRDQKCKRIQEIVEVPDLNPGSSKQMVEVLYKKMGLKVKLHHKTKELTADKNAMEKLAREYPGKRDLFDAIREFGSLKTFINGFYSLELTDGRLRTSYNVAGTVTDRLNSSETWLYPSTNLQNIQKPTSGPMRRCFVAGVRRLLLKADLSQAEFRIVVWLARIRRLIQRYLQDPNFDVHTWVASLIYNMPEEKIGKDSVERTIAKNGVYGGNYKMHYVTAARTYKLDLQTAKFVLEKYRAAIPEIPQWWETVDDTIRRTRTIVSPFGNRRIFFGRFDDDTFRQAYSHSAQTIVAHTINRAAVLADTLFDPHECPLLMQVHDELVFNPLEECAEDYAKALKSIMEYPIKFDGVDEPLTIPADVSLGVNWLDQKKVKVIL